MEQNTEKNFDAIAAEMKEQFAPELTGKPVEEGQYTITYENEADEKDYIETRTYANGNKVKTFLLSDGRRARVRVLKGRDTFKMAKMQGVSKELQDEEAMGFMIALATTIDGQEYSSSYFLDELGFADYGKIMAVCSSVNFS